jgi:hypothetical protein
MNDFEKQLASQPLKSVPTEWRAQILKEARGQATHDIPASPAQPLSWLRELFWPNPQAWGALAAVWFVIAVFKFITPGAAPAMNVEMAKAPVASVSEQRRELANLLDATSDKSNRSPADRPRSARFVPQSFV